jgi:diguanylate cyclase (GGDEF)-like protein
VVILENHRLIRRQMATEAALRASEEAQRRLALHDTLTGLPNRRLLTDRIEQAIALSRRHRESFAVMLVDLDRFKQVNDQYGHHAGDRLLQHVARRLQGEVRDSDTVARLGGDEFAVLLLDISDTDARAVGEVLVEVLHAPFLLDGPVASIGGSVGVAMFPRDGDDYQTLMQHADDAMYLAKRSRTGVALYDPERPDDTISILNIS